MSDKKRAQRVAQRRANQQLRAQALAELRRVMPMAYAQPEPPVPGYQAPDDDLDDDLDDDDPPRGF